MKLSPLDIKKQEFKRTMRGYDAEEVQAFLDMLAAQWEQLLAEHRRAEDRLRELKGKLDHYQRVEEALQEALQTARESSKQTLENAKQEAALIVKKAVGEADDLTRSATRQRDLLLQEIDHLHGRRDEAVAKLRAFLLSEVEILERFDEREWATTRPKAARSDLGPTTTTGASLPETPVSVVSSEEEMRRPPAVDPAEAAAEPADAPAKAAPVVDETLPGMVGLDAALKEVSDVSAGLDTAPADEEEPLSFRFFEPHEERDTETFFQDEAVREIVRFGPEADLSRKGDRPPADDTWIVRPVVASPRVTADEHAAPEGLTASSEEIEKIRRILNDLD